MAIKPTPFIWHNGRYVPWEEATVHVLAHGLHYGSSLFEGIRSYATPRGPMFFRLTDHLQRLTDSARIYGMQIPYSPAEMNAACRGVVTRNQLTNSYLRPIVYRGAGSLSLFPSADTPVEAAVAAIEWGPYLGQEALDKGVEVCVSSWTRPAPNTLPMLAKAGGHYLSGQLIAGEAARHGYAEGIALDAQGHLSEGAGENLFLVKKEVLYTTPLACSILQGITRDSVLTLAKSLGFRVEERTLPREFLYVADEAFFTGTAVEITPIRSVDRIAVGDGTPGPVTRALQKAFFGLFTHPAKDHWHWLEPVSEEAPTSPDAVSFASSSPIKSMPETALACQ